MNRTKVWIWLAAVVYLVVMAAIAFKLRYENNLVQCWEAQCVTFFEELFAPVVWMAEFGLAIVVLLTIFHRIGQTSEQLDKIDLQLVDTRTINTFRDYLSHREAFFDLLSSYENPPTYQIEKKDYLYRKFFPDNSPHGFSPHPGEPNTSADTIEARIKDFNDIIKRLNDMGKATESFRKKSTRELCRLISEFNRCRNSLGVSQLDDADATPKNASMMGIFSKVPLDLKDSIYRTGSLIEGLRDFGYPKKTKEQLEVAHLLYPHINESEAYSHLLPGVTLESGLDGNVYDDGKLSRVNGKDISENPHQLGSPEHDAWSKGWNSDNGV